MLELPRRPADAVATSSPPRWCSTSATASACSRSPTTAERLRLESALLARETAMLRELPSLPAVDLARTPSGVN